MELLPLQEVYISLDDPYENVLTEIYCTKTWALYKDGKNIQSE